MSSTNGTDTTPHYRTIFEMSPAEIEVIKQDVAGYLNGLRAAHFGWAVISTLLAWDILRTMDKEIHYVWKSRWSYAKVIFLANRYLAPTTFFIEGLVLFRTPSSFNINECSVPGWFWIIACTLSVTTVSFVLGSRVWAIYERDRRVLIGLLAGFLACYVPPWTLTFLAGVKGGYDKDRVLWNVWLYIGGVVMEDGLDALDWRLRKCYRFHFPKVNNSIILGSLLYESGICAAMVWKMFQDKKKTRIIEAFYRDGLVYYCIMFCTYGLALGLGFSFRNPIAQGLLTCAFYTAIKSMICSHIILRLRSYFTDGDPIIDGYDRTDPFEGHLGGKLADSSFVSTIIRFAHVFSRSGGDVAFELRSKHAARGAEQAPLPLDELGLAGEIKGEKTSFQIITATAVLSSPRPRPPQELDWTDIPDPHHRRSILGEPSGSHRVENAGLSSEQQPVPRKLRLFRKRPQCAGDRQRGDGEAPIIGTSGHPTQTLAARSMQELNGAVETDDLTTPSRNGTIRRAISDPNLLAGEDRILARSEQPPPRSPGRDP